MVFVHSKLLIDNVLSYFPRPSYALRLKFD